MGKRTDEDKIAEQLQEVLDNHWFNPSICASVIVSRFPLYTQDKLMDLMKEIIKEQASKFRPYWEEGVTSEAIMLASHLAEVIEMHEPIA
jgi:hypothetical protein